MSGKGNWGVSKKSSEQSAYRKIRKHASNLVPSGYEITNRCNLKCEGCFFYEGEHFDARDGLSEVDDLNRYTEFFRSEVARGVSYPQFTGGDPSLVQGRLKVANRFWKNGVVYTNGIIKIDPEISFMLHIGAWTVDGEKDTHLRGAPAITKALENYAGDRRAIIDFTISHTNIDEIPSMVELCAAHDIRLVFNHYSPTRQYMKKITENSDFDPNGTFRFSSKDESLLLTEADLGDIRERIEWAIRDYPETVIYSRYFNEWINRPGSLYEIDPDSGRATNCTIFNDPRHRQYQTDLSFDDTQCCVPNNDCRECRLYPVAYSQYLRPGPSKIRSENDFRDWIDVMESWCRMHILDWDELPDC